MKNRACISLNSIHFKNEFHSFQKWIPASELYSIRTVMKFDAFCFLNAWYMYNFFSPFLNRLRLDPAIFGLVDLIDDHHAIQATVLETQHFNLLFDQKNSIINEEANIDEFHQHWWWKLTPPSCNVAQFRSVITAWRHEILLFEQFFEKKSKFSNKRVEYIRSWWILTIPRKKRMETSRFWLRWMFQRVIIYLLCISFVERERFPTAFVCASEEASICSLDSPR
jgi:hypothetical protein